MQPISDSNYTEVPAPFSLAAEYNNNLSSYSFWRDNRKATSPVAN
jgi:hypothetical protein